MAVPGKMGLHAGRSIHSLAAALACLAAAACTQGDDYQQPGVPTPSDYRFRPPLLPAAPIDHRCSYRNYSEKQQRAQDRGVYLRTAMNVLRVVMRLGVSGSSIEGHDSFSIDS